MRKGWLGVSRSPAELTRNQVHWIQVTSNIPRRFFGRDLSDIVADTGNPVAPEVEAWLDDVLQGKIIMELGGLGTNGVGLLFDGRPGLGKTTYAVTVALELLYRLPADPEEGSRVLKVKHHEYGKRLRPVYYTTMTELLNLKKSAMDYNRADQDRSLALVDEIYGRSDDTDRNVRVLVLDDVGKEYGSKYDEFVFDELIRGRYDRGLPTILTTNKPRETWGTVYSESMGSFGKEAFRRVELVGGDLRG